MSTTISPACLKCGTIKKSGKASCCGRGGSWFENCGGAANVKHDHTWYEGIRVCKALPQSSAVIEQHRNENQETDVGHFSNGDGMTNFRLVFTSTKLFTTLVSDGTTTACDPAHTSASTSTITQGCETLFNLALVTSVFSLSV